MAIVCVALRTELSARVRGPRVASLTAVSAVPSLLPADHEEESEWFIRI